MLCFLLLYKWGKDDVMGDDNMLEIFKYLVSFEKGRVQNQKKQDCVRTRGCTITTPGLKTAGHRDAQHIKRTILSHAGKTVIFDFQKYDLLFDIIRNIRTN